MKLLSLIFFIPSLAMAQTFNLNPPPSSTFDDLVKLAQIISAFATPIVLLLTLRLSILLKSSEVIEGYHRRWDDVVKALSELTTQKPTSEAATIYYKRFWNIQHDQFSDWEECWIPNKVYKEWLKARRAEWKSNTLLSGISYQEGWHQVRGQYAGSASQTDNKFVLCMDRVLTSQDDIGDIMRRYSPRWWKRIRRGGIF